jgi:hypothetical protein
MAKKLFFRRIGLVWIPLYAFAVVLLLAAFTALAMSRSSIILSVAAVIGALASLLLYKIARRARVKIFPSYEALEIYLAQRDEPLFVFLREFTSDTDRGDTDIEDWPRLFVSEEEKIANHFRGYGMMLAIGRPGERLPAGGSFRMYVDDNGWRSVVSQLIIRADLILLRCGLTPGISWELEQIIAHGKLDQTIVIPSSNSERNVATFERLRSLLQPPSTSTELETAMISSTLQHQMTEMLQTMRRNLAHLDETGKRVTRIGIEALERQLKADEELNFQLRMRASLIRIEAGRLVPIEGDLGQALDTVSRDLGFKIKMWARVKRGLSR